MGFQRRKENGVHAPVPAFCGRSCGGSMTDQLRRLDLVAVLSAVNRGRDLLGHPIGGAPVNWVEFAGGLRIEYVVLVANGDLRLLPGNLEMVVAFLEHLPEGKVRGIAMSRHVERSHAERIGLNLK